MPDLGFENINEALESNFGADMRRYVVNGGGTNLAVSKENLRGIFKGNTMVSCTNT